MSRKDGFKDIIQIWHYVKVRLLFSIGIGILSLFLVIYIKNWKYFPDLVVSVIVSVVVFLLFTLKDATSIYNLRNRIDKAENVYKDLIDAHINLPADYSNFMDKRIVERDFKNGIIMLNIDDEKYSRWLDDCSLKLNESYCATFSHPYSIKGTLSTSSISNQEKGKATPEIAIEHFVKTNKLSCKKGKKRIYVLNKDSFFSDIKDKAIEDKVLIEFFKSQSTFKLYLLDKDEMRIGNDNLFNRFYVPMTSDYAIFDSALVIKRLEDKQLSYFFVNNGFNTVPTAFREFFEDEPFKYCSSGFYQLTETMKLLRCRNKAFDRDELTEKIKIDLKIT